MTILLALGWPVALFCAWRWSVARGWKPAAEGWEEAAQTWMRVALAAERQCDDNRALAEKCQANATAALALAEDWKNIALLLNAALFQPIRGTASFGRLQ